MTPTSIYLDGHSTTPLAPEAFEAMAPWWHRQAGNPHSPHLRGMLAAQTTEEARRSVAELVGADSQEIVFTSGATEANNLAIRGVAETALVAGDARNEIVVSAIEHKSVLAAAASLSTRGFNIVIAPVLRTGVVDLTALRELVSERTLLVSVMAVNNEVGSIQPLQEVATIARTSGAMFHVDAAQALGKIPFDASEFDFASFSSHKVYGPMGIGALFVSAAAQYRPSPILFGGTQEGGLRPGTVPTPLVVGFGAAARLGRKLLEQDSRHSAMLAERLLQELDGLQVKYFLNVPEQLRAPGSLSMRFPGADAVSVIGKIGDKVSISEGSACTSGQINSSHVLTSMSITSEEAAETLRIFCSRYNTIAEIEIAARVLANVLHE
ncbi:cysteine desulfurase family protein [Mesorhizobium sp. M0019]|uniref:cysteine desulfurase family protein n=1 Tax=Mesorhizobium sp. M0019 TaxID=2956845 RepID=UPI00333991C6